MPRQGLTSKQKRFVEEYLIDMNATQACIRAGYSAKTADRIGPELLGKTWVAEEIEKGRAKLSKKSGIDAEWALARLKKEAEFDGDGSSHSARVTAINTAMKHLGMLTEKYEHSGQLTTATVQIILPDNGRPNTDQPTSGAAD